MADSISKSKSNVWSITELGCPDCAGVLKARNDGHGDHRLFECHVGHRFSLQSLLKSKELQLECALWTSLVLLAHVEMVCEEFANDHAQNGKLQRAVIRKRIRETRDHQRTVRFILEDTHVCQLGEP